MDTDELYLAIVDNVCEELNKYHFESRKELHEKIEGLANNYTEMIENIFAEIEDDYADTKGIEWEE